MSGYIGVTPVPKSTQNRQVFTATAGQTSFATAGYTPGYVDVYLNGVKLIVNEDYTSINGSDIILASGAELNDSLEVISFSTFDVAEVPQVVRAEYKNHSTTVANQSLKYTTKVEDTHNIYNTTTGVITIPVSGIYEIGFILGSASANQSQYMDVNGVSNFKLIGQTFVSHPTRISQFTHRFTQGDYFIIKTDNVALANAIAWLTINMIGS